MQFKKEHHIKKEKSSDNIWPESEFGVILRTFSVQDSWYENIDAVTKTKYNRLSVFEILTFCDYPY